MATLTIRNPRRRRTGQEAPTALTSTDTTAPSAARGNEPIGSERRHAMICEAAYYLAERRGFSVGAVLDDWLAAEREVDRLLTLNGAADEAGS